MKKITLLAALAALLTSSGCQKTSGNIWEDNQTGARYSHQNAASLWGGSSNETAMAERTSFEATTDEFLPLGDEDLQSQFSDGAVPQGQATLGENGVPSSNEFADPEGQLSSVFAPVFFNTNDHILRGKDHLEVIQKVATYLKEHPGTSVIIEGHCDERGPEAFNIALGARRASYVRSLLVKQGVNPTQLHTISYGAENPFVFEHTPSAWSQNRRAHFRVHAK